MMAQSSLKCPSCHLFFGFQNTPKILKNCHHTICIHCLQHINNCPIDGKAINVNKWGFKSFLTDTRILQLIQDQTYPSNTHCQDIKFSILTRSENERHQLFLSSSELRQNLSNWQMCKTHMKKADYICKQNLTIACYQCIGSQNETNSFMSYEELLKHFTSLTDETYKIYENLNKKAQLLTKRNIDNFIEQEIKKKKQRQGHDIRHYFQRLIEKIRKQQKQVLQQLDQIAISTMKNIKSQIDLNPFHNNKEQWGQQVQKVISVMEGVYDWAGFQQAFEYLEKGSNKADLVDQGKKLMDQLSRIDQKVHDLVKEEMKKLQYRFDERFIMGITDICCFGLTQPKPPMDPERLNQQQKSNSSRTNLKIYNSFSQTVFLTNATLQPFPLNTLQKQSLHFENSFDQQQPQNQVDYASQSSSEDFLLDTQKSSFHHNQTLTKNEITFQENFSILDNCTMPPREQFTPILRKDQDQISVLQDQSTIININHQKKEQSPFLYTKSEDITIELKPIKINKKITSSCQKIFNSSAELSKTLVNLSTHKKQRSPLKSVNSNITQSQKKKLGISQKYIPMWQSARYDNTENIDLTGAQLGDKMALQLASYISESQIIKSVKLIRNKLTDECVRDLILRLTRSSVSSLNLSQNMLTEKTLNTLQEMDLGKLKSITLSLNKIVLRKVKDKIEKFKERGVTLTV